MQFIYVQDKNSGPIIKPFWDATDLPMSSPITAEFNKFGGISKKSSF